MKSRLSLLVVMLGAVTLALFGVLRDVNTTKAIIPLPVKPVSGGQSETLRNSTALGATTHVVALATGSHGMRSAASSGWAAGGIGRQDILIDDGVALGNFLSITDMFCNSSEPGVGHDIVATAASNTTPYTFNEANTDLYNTGNTALLPLAGTFPITARFESLITNIWLNGNISYDLIPSNSTIPVNIISLSCPWKPNCGTSQIWVGGSVAAKPSTAVCAQGADGGPTDRAISVTDGTGTTPVDMTFNSPIRGDSGGPCDTATTECTDVQVAGFWTLPQIATGSPAVISVTKRALNSGPEVADFKDVWHVEAPANVGVLWNASLAKTFSAGGYPAASFGGASTVTATVSGTELSFSEANVPVGQTNQYVGSLTLTCSVAGDYLVVIKNASYPLAGNTDNDQNNNASVTTIRVKCPVAAAGETEMQLLRVGTELTAISAGSAGMNPTIGVVDPLVGDQLNLVVGDNATLDITWIGRNQRLGTDAGDAGMGWLEAEAPDLDGNGTYDIGVNFSSGSVAGISGSDPGPNTPINVSPLAVSASCIARGGQACAGLAMSMTEPPGWMEQITADLTITCNAAGTYLVPVKAVNMPTTKGDPVPGNNATWVPVTVKCWTNTAAWSAAVDGIDDSTGLYPSWNTVVFEGDPRKSISPTSRPDTAIPSDTTWTERSISVGQCIWQDIAGTTPDVEYPVGSGIWWVSPAATAAAIPAGIDKDGDCLADTASAQPGRGIDTTDVAGATNCPAITYNDGKPVANMGYPVPNSSKVIYSVSADQDCDGLMDGIEYFFGSNPRLADTDGDGATDFVENIQFTTPVNPDTDGDGYLDKPEDDYNPAACANALDDDSDTKVNDGCPAVGAPETLTACNLAVDDDSDGSVNDGCPVVSATGEGDWGETTLYADDNCPSVYNDTQTNTDGVRRLNGPIIAGEMASNPNQDKMGDACDPDDDNDGASDVAETEVAPATLPLNPDTDGDRCLDGYESYAGTNPTLSTSKCPATLTAAVTLFVKGCHVNLPGTAAAPDFAPGYPGGIGTQWVENDIDGDGIACVLPSSPVDKDSDNGNGGNVTAPAEVLDAVELYIYGTSITRKDSDGDGCEDWVEMMDINGSRGVDIADQLSLARRVVLATGYGPDPISDKFYDLSGDGYIDITDQLLMARNSCTLKLGVGGCPACPAEN